MRLIKSNDKSEQEIQGEISYNAYRKLSTRLKDMNKEELWAVLRHDIFHRLNDGDVDELSTILDQMQSKGLSVSASTLETLVMQITAEAEEVEEVPLNIANSRKYFVTDLPSLEDLQARKDQIDLLYDANFFTNYLHPEIRKQTAQMLIDFASNQKLPIQELWTSVASDSDSIVSDEEQIL